MTNAILFSGQGSQYKGMGNELQNEFKKEYKMAEEILYYSLEGLINENENNLLDNTLYTQPALYFVSCLAYKKRMMEANIEFTYAAGHSLGEFCALYATGVFDLETGLKIVAKRSKLMATIKNGAMAAIIGLEDKLVNDILRDYEDLYISNYNTKEQTVISGTKEAIKAVQEIFINNGAKGYHILNVSCPCHSPFVKKTAEEFRSYIEQFTFNQPQFHVMSNYTGEEYEFSEIKDTMAYQMYNPVKWKQIITYLMQKGVDNFEISGPSSALSKILKYNLSEAKE